LGSYQFQRIRKDRFFAFNLEDLGEGQIAYMAEPEKALLDLVYLRSGGEEPSYLRSLRLQNLEGIDIGRLREIAQKYGSPKITRAAENVILIKGEE
jgi:hypothetical protein